MDKGNDPSIVIQIIQKYDDKLMFFWFVFLIVESDIIFVCDYNITVKKFA